MITEKTLETYDELSRKIEQYSQKMHEKYGIFFPELENILEDTFSYALFVKNYPYRNEMDEFDLIGLKEVTLNEETAKEILKASATTKGVKLTQDELLAVRVVGSLVVELITYKHCLDTFLVKRKQYVSPELQLLIDSKIVNISKPGTVEYKKIRQIIDVIGLHNALLSGLDCIINASKNGLYFHTSFFHEEEPKRCLQCLADQSRHSLKMECFCYSFPFIFSDSVRLKIESELQFYDIEAFSIEKIKILKHEITTEYDARRKRRGFTT